jgi:hypothetical protein
LITAHPNIYDRSYSGHMRPLQYRIRTLRESACIKVAVRVEEQWVMVTNVRVR